MCHVSRSVSTVSFEGNENFLEYEWKRSERSSFLNSISTSVMYLENFYDFMSIYSNDSSQISLVLLCRWKFKTFKFSQLSR